MENLFSSGMYELIPGCSVVCGAASARNAASFEAGESVPAVPNAVSAVSGECALMISAGIYDDVPDGILLSSGTYGLTPMLSAVNGISCVPGESKLSSGTYEGVPGENVFSPEAGTSVSVFPKTNSVASGESNLSSGAYGDVPGEGRPSSGIYVSISVFPSE